MEFKRKSKVYFQKCFFQKCILQKIILQNTIFRFCHLYCCLRSYLCPIFFAEKLSPSTSSFKSSPACFFRHHIFHLISDISHICNYRNQVNLEGVFILAGILHAESWMTNSTNSFLNFSK